MAMDEDYMVRFIAALKVHGLVYGPSTTDKDWSVTAADGTSGNFFYGDIAANAKRFATPEEAAQKFAEFFNVARRHCGW